MPKHVADQLENRIVASLKSDPALDRAIRAAIRHHLERIVAENGRLRMALAHAVLDTAPE